MAEHSAGMGASQHYVRHGSQDAEVRLVGGGVELLGEGVA